LSRKKVDREAQQQKILNKARLLFAEKGVENTNMDDIAAAFGYTRRTLYNYFRSREEVSLMILIEDLSTRWGEQQKAIEKAESGLAGIVIWGESLYDFTKRNPQSIRLQLFWDLKGIDKKNISDDIFEKFEKLNNELADGLRRIFDTGVKDGSLRPDLQIDISISQYVYSLRNILNRAISSTYSFSSFDPDTYVNHFLDLFKRGIQNMGGNQS